MKNCHACGAAWDGSPGTQPGRGETCTKCGADLHCCRNCRLFEPAAHRECTSSTTDPPRDKERHNFCEEFDMAGGRGPSGGGAGGDTKKKWDDLFK